MAAVENAQEEENRSPPDVGVQVVEHYGIRGRMRELVETGGENQQPVHQQRDADEEPDGDGALGIHVITRK